MKQGKWIAYPGDYEMLLAEKISSRRWQRDFLISPFWRIDSPWHNVKFVREFSVPEDTEIFVAHEGTVSLFFEGPNKYLENFSGRVPLKKGSYKIHFWVYNPDGLPCIRIDGDYFYSDKRMFAAYDQFQLYPAEEIDCGDMTPNTFCLPKREIKAISCENTDGGKLYDFGKIFMGYCAFEGCKDEPIRCYYGETRAEALSDRDCEQISFFTPENGKYADKISKAFRYLRVVSDSEYFLRVEEEYNPKKSLLNFYSADTRLTKIAQIADYTFSVCDREFFLDGAKRDRWLWEGDAYQAYKLDYYRACDFAAVKRNIVAAFGKSPVTTYINHIMDYTMYAILSVEEYYLHSGDVEFLQRIFPILKEHMDFAVGRVNKSGFLYGLRGDWIFVDWNSSLDTSGELSFEEMLFYLALRAFCSVGKAIGADVSKYNLRARKLKKEINKVFWDEERGVYRHSRKDGVVGEEVTAYANIFAVLYGFADEKKRAKIGQALLSDPSIPEITTPYMQSYKLSCLFELGRYEIAAKEINDYWGGMADAGATTFWEYYEKGDSEISPRPMYGRPFGMSHCHIWGASVLYLIPRYFYGIRTDLKLGETFEIRPILPLIRESRITVALKRGSLEIEEKNGKLSVYSSDLDGTLYIGNRRRKIVAGKKTVCKVKNFVEESK